MDVVWESMAREHRALMRQYGEAQVRCSQLIAQQAAEIARLQAQSIRLHAAIVLRDTALAWANESSSRAQPVCDTGTQPEDLEKLEASIVAADLVICQTGCLSHGEYWRVQDHCKRTGKACVLVEKPQAVRIVRITAEGHSA